MMYTLSLFDQYGTFLQFVLFDDRYQDLKFKAGLSYDPTTENTFIYSSYSAESLIFPNPELYNFDLHFIK